MLGSRARDKKKLIEARNRFNFTPMHVAAINGKDGIVKKLIEEGADVDSVGKFKCVSLHLAA